MKPILTAIPFDYFLFCNFSKHDSPALQSQFKIDTLTLLEDMSTATTINIVSPANETSLTSFDNGYKFRYGLDTIRN